MTIRDISDRSDLILVTDSQDVDAVREHLSDDQGFDSYFVAVGDGEYSEVYGFDGCVALLDKPLYPVNCY